MSKAGHPIYALWSHPRSMSTAMERVMRERGDLDCAHEPFMYDYYIHRRGDPFPSFDVQPDHPTVYSDIRDMLLRRAAEAPVFIKDMSYYVYPHILEDAHLEGRLINMFLIRDPVGAIASYHKLDADFSLEEVGLEAQSQHFQALRDRGEDPPVIDAYSVRNAPREVMAALWERVGLPFVDSAFEWDQEMPEDWKQVKGWHGQAGRSTGITPISDADLERERARFEAAAADAPHLRDYLAHHRPFYEKLRAHAL